jgi:hypothetical protein
MSRKVLWWNDWKILLNHRVQNHIRSEQCEFFIVLGFKWLYIQNLIDTEEISLRRYFVLFTNLQGRMGD